MSTTTNNCKLLCASAAAYLIQTTYPSGISQLDLLNPKSLPPHILRPIIPENTKNQYNAIGMIENPYVVISDDKINACMIGKTASEIIIAFRGTLPPAWTLDAILDWIQDIFMSDTVSHPNITGKVHDGFLKALMSLAANIYTVVKTLDASGSMPIYVTGHSKGGGMAPIAAMFFKNAFHMNITQTVTFAGPKPGNGDFCNAYNSMFPNDIRYENYLDIVPLLPPSNEFIKDLLLIPFLPTMLRNLLHKALSWDYETVGTLRYIDDKGQVSPPPPMIVRIGEIMKDLVTGHVSEIADAHHASCGFRYMEGTCEGSVCKNISS